MSASEHKPSQGSRPQDQGSAILSEQQKQAISTAFHSTLLSNPHITLEIVRRSAES